MSAGEGQGAYDDYVRTGTNLGPPMSAGPPTAAIRPTGAFQPPRAAFPPGGDVPQYGRWGADPGYARQPQSYPLPAPEQSGISRTTGRMIVLLLALHNVLLMVLVVLVIAILAR